MKLEFQAVNWEARDLESRFVISAFGKTRDGKSVCVHTEFNPYFFVKNKGPNECWSMQKTYDKDINKFRDMAESVGTVEQKDIWGFQNNKKHLFTKIDFNTIGDMKKVGYRMKNKKWKLYEFNIPPLLRFYHRTGIQPTGWLTLDVVSSAEEDITNCDIEGWCDWEQMEPLDMSEQAPLVTTSFDIECYSASRQFPDSTKFEDKLFQIACSSQRLGSSDIFSKVCFVLGDEVKVNGDYEIVACKTEHRLIEAFRDHLDDVKCDVLTGWNIFGFDLKYIINRLDCPIRFGRLTDIPQKLDDMYEEKELSSSALGNNHLFILQMPGIFVFDLYHHIRKEYKLDSYKLNNVALHFLKDEKLDVTPQEIFEAWGSHDLDKLARVAEYCVKDTSLPLDIITKTCSLINLLEMAKATWVPIKWLIERGQQIKVFSQVSKKARELGFLIPTDPFVLENQTYEGATVLEPHRGVHWNPVTALDFKSLYPSIMRAHNLCYSTFMTNDSPDVECKTFNVGDDEYKFAINVPSVLPAVLEELAEFRTQAKRDMKKHAGTFLAQVYDGKQLAYKVSMNSVYGFTGVSRGFLPFMPIASSVTCQGRQMIEDTKNMVEKEFPGSIVRYGDTDSVMVEFKTETEGSIQESWDMGVVAAKRATEMFQHPNELELEKIYTPFFLFNKKRYAALKYEDPKGEPTIDVKGIQLVRRDNCKMVKTVSRGVLNMLLYDRDTEGAASIVKDTVIDLIEGRIPMDQLIISKSLRDNYKSTSQPHLTVREHMRLRNPGSEPRSGERVPYVYIDTGDRKHKQYQKAEDPDYARENGLPIDTKYYINNQMKKSITPLFELLHDNAEQLLFDDISTHHMKQTKGTYGWSKKGEVYKNQPTITDMFAHHLKNSSS